MAEQKFKSVVLSRSLTVHHNGEKHELVAGKNTLPEHIADHPFVKAHAVDVAAVDDVAVDAKAGKKIAELTAAVKAANERADAAEAKAAELQTMLDAFTATAPQGNGKK